MGTHEENRVKSVSTGGELGLSGMFMNDRQCEGEGGGGGGGGGGAGG